MNRYILLAPNSWHQWQQLEAPRPQREQKNEAPVDKAEVDNVT